jgi:PilZ domain.
MIIRKRVPKRTTAFLQAVLKSEDATQKVCIRDISVNGALLDAERPLRVFEMVTLLCGDSSVNGIVAWSENGRVGMEFSELLTSDLLVDSLQRGMKVSAPRNYRNGRMGEADGEAATGLQRG